jgi:hypothetical protein
MDPIDKFLKQYSYKFPKGYPDMKNEQDILLMETLLNNLGISLKEATPPSANKKAVKALVDAYPDKFNSQSESNRISNLQKISPEEFIQLIKQTFDNTNVTVYSPGISPNVKPKGSSKFSMYEFNTPDGLARLLLSGGQGSNKGNEFETSVFANLQANTGKALDDIEDPITKQIYKTLGIDPSTLSPNDIEQTGNKDTKRPISFEGAKDRGKTIADVVITYDKKPYYLSIKNVSGSGLYNGGVVPGINFNTDKSKIIFDKSSLDSNVFISKLLKTFGVDPQKIVDGLNNYINKTGKNSDFESTNGNLEDIKELLGSSIDYGYYYIREINPSEVKIIHIDSPETAASLIGNPTSVKIKYPGSNTKQTTVRIPLEKSEIGAKHIDVDIRNTSGGIDKPSIKININ